ncbi:hypothetical protein PR259_00400 [Metamycoplasma hyosynoviae]|nr:hypothetical protein [Metamycoplasma hyosynoviae]MDC8900055.1 hypothetical protein [Metamycoplasma hyosynoviae]
MNKPKKVILTIASIASLSTLPIAAISCVRLTSMQKKVKSKILEIKKIAKEKGISESTIGIINKYTTDEEIAKLSDDQCAALILALDAVLATINK